MKKIITLSTWKMFLILTFSFSLLIINGIGDFNTSKLDNLAIAAIIRIIGIAVYFLWLLVLGLKLNSSSKTYYKFRNSTYILSVLICTLGYVNLNLSFIFKSYNQDLFGISFLLSLFTLLALIYTFYSLSKSVKSAQLQRDVKFVECVPEALLLFIFPIGIWILQPKIISYLRD
jgi:hypothetical protein